MERATQTKWAFLVSKILDADMAILTPYHGLNPNETCLAFTSCSKGSSPKKKVKKASSDYRQKCVNATRDILMTKVSKMTVFGNELLLFVITW